MKSFRSCLIIFLAVVASLILLVVLLFVGGRTYGQWRMAQVTQDLASLARDLGYTPDTHLHHRIAVRDVSIITGSAYCEAKLYYTTPMSPAEFTERVNQSEPEAKEKRREDLVFNLSGVIPSLTVRGGDPQAATPTSQSEPMMIYLWTLRDRSYKTYLSFYDATNLSATMEHEGQQIKGNIIELSMEGGLFPIWVDCPGTFRDAPDAPFD